MRTLRLGIDPGHGLNNRRPGVYDPGAVAGGVAEADVVLSWALTLKFVAARMGLRVTLTRDTPEGDPVWARAGELQRAGCTHLLSLHCNAGGVLATGTETFYRDEEDKAFAAVVQRHALAATGLRDRGLKHESRTQHKRLAVLGFDGPAVLLETGFITNARDRKRLLSRDVRLAFATSFLSELARG